ncbi:hypothetical protein [Geobacter sp.]|uniref:YncE family protein n=1 Tax=Geobacter sp. TaxID=46610 RepID=UPI00263987D0|nr:hypothetical protein [Geobacter sp.]
MKRLKLLLAFYLVVGVASSAVAGVKRDVPLLYQTLGTKNTPIAVGLTPRGMAFDGLNMWVANYDSGTVSKIDIYTNNVIATISVTGTPASLTFDGTYVWCVSDSNVYQIDPSQNSVIGSVALSGYAWGSAFDGQYL